MCADPKRAAPDLEGQVVDVSGLEAGAQRGVQRVALVLGHRKSKRDDPEVLANADDLPGVQLPFGVLLHTRHTRRNQCALERLHGA